MFEGFMIRAGCSPNRNVDRDVRVPAKACQLSTNGKDAVLQITVDPNSFQGAPYTYELPGFAGHSPTTPYVARSKNDYSSVDTGVSVGLPMGELAPMRMTTSYAISRVKVEFTKDEHIRTIEAIRQTAPIVLGHRFFGKWLDKVTCVFGPSR